MAWLTRNKSLQNASVCYKHAPVMEHGSSHFIVEMYTGMNIWLQLIFQLPKNSHTTGRQERRNPNGSKWEVCIDNKFLFVSFCAVFPKAFFYTCPFPIGKSYRWTIGPWPSPTAGRLFGAKRSPHSPLRGIPADVRHSMFFDVLLQLHNRNSTGISSTCSIFAFAPLSHSHILPTCGRPVW